MLKLLEGFLKNRKFSLKISRFLESIFQELYKVENAEKFQKGGLEAVFKTIKEYCDQ